MSFFKGLGSRGPVYVLLQGLRIERTSLCPSRQGLRIERTSLCPSSRA